MFIFYYITTYKCCNKNIIVPGRNRTFDDRLTADNFTIKLQGQKKCAKQDSNLRILRYVGLSDAA